MAIRSMETQKIARKSMIAHATMATGCVHGPGAKGLRPLMLSPPPA